MAVYIIRSDNRSFSRGPPPRPHTFELGRQQLDVGARNPLAIYSPERSLLDIIRIRHLQGSDLAWEALRRH